MTSRTHLNLLLFSAIIVLTAITRIYPVNESSDEMQQITPLSVNDVHQILLQRSVRDDLLLIQSDNKNSDWSIDATPPLPAGDFQLSALLKLAEQTAVRSYTVSSLDPGKLGLDPPRAVVTLNSLPIRFGGLEPLESLRYVQVDDMVHLIPDIYMQLIESPSSQFVRHQLFDADSKLIAISLPDFKAHWKTSRWLITPEQTLSADSIQQFISRWERASAIFIRNATTITDQEKIVVKLEKNNERIEYFLTGTGEDLVLTRPDLNIEYHLGQRSHEFLKIQETSE